MSKMNATLQKFLLALGILALLFLLVEIGASLAATQHGSTCSEFRHEVQHACCNSTPV